MKDVCREGQIRVAFNQYVGVFEVEDNAMKEVPTLSSSIQSHMAANWEVLSTFFEYHQLRPDYFENEYIWGYFDTQAQQWRGAVAMVRYFGHYNQ